MTDHPKLSAGVQKTALFELIRIAKDLEIEAQFGTVTVNDLASRWLEAVAPTIEAATMKRELERGRRRAQAFLAALDQGAAPQDSEDEAA